MKYISAFAIISHYLLAYQQVDATFGLLNHLFKKGLKSTDGSYAGGGYNHDLNIDSYGKYGGKNGNRFKNYDGNADYPRFDEVRSRDFYNDGEISTDHPRSRDFFNDNNSFHNAADDHNFKGNDEDSIGGEREHDDASHENHDETRDHASASVEQTPSMTFSDNVTPEATTDLSRQESQVSYSSTKTVYLTITEDENAAATPTSTPASHESDKEIGDEGANKKSTRAFKGAFGRRRRDQTAGDRNENGKLKADSDKMLKRVRHGGEENASSGEKKGGSAVNESRDHVSNHNGGKNNEVVKVNDNRNRGSFENKTDSSHDKTDEKPSGGSNYGALVQLASKDGSKSSNDSTTADKKVNDEGGENQASTTSISHEQPTPLASEEAGYGGHPSKMDSSASHDQTAAKNSTVSPAPLSSKTDHEAHNNSVSPSKTGDEQGNYGDKSKPAPSKESFEEKSRNPEPSPSSAPSLSTTNAPGNSTANNTTSPSGAEPSQDIPVNSSPSVPIAGYSSTITSKAHITSSSLISTMTIILMSFSSLQF